MTSRQKALLAAELVKAKNGEDLVVLEIKRLSNITDFFVVCTASSTKRAQAIADHIEEGLVKAKESVGRKEGYEQGNWIVFDAYDVIVHIFTQETRDFYNLEDVWSKAPKVRICQRKKKTRTKKTLKRK